MGVIIRPSITVGVKFCGNCNPVLDAARLLEELQSRFKGIKLVHLANGNRQKVDKVLVISGCPADCATKPEKDRRVMTVVAGLSVNGTPVIQQELISKLAEALGISGVKGGLH